MKISYAVTGQERKSLACAISQELNAPAKYLGAPTFAYEVGGYHIDKTGTVTGCDNEKLAGKLAEQGFAGEAEYENLTAHGKEAADSGQADYLTVEFPLDTMNSDAIENLTKMVTAKEDLIKAALGAEDIPIRMTKETLQFPWFTLSDPGEAAYYVQFVFALCESAKEKKRVTAKEYGLPENPKYAMRCWLLSLGLIGAEYKNARKLLLSRLGGNSSFKGGSRPTYTAHCFTYPNGEEGEAMDCTTEDFTSLARARAHCDAFAAECESLKFAGAHVEDESGRYIYELFCE